MNKILFIGQNYDRYEFALMLSMVVFGIFLYYYMTCPESHDTLDKVGKSLSVSRNFLAFLELLIMGMMLKNSVLQKDDEVMKVL